MDRSGEWEKMQKGDASGKVSELEGLSWDALPGAVPALRS